MDVRARHRVVSKYKYCANCLAKSHELRACPSMDTCRKCGNYHHTLLHPGIKSRLINLKRPHRGPVRSLSSSNNRTRTSSNTRTSAINRTSSNSRTSSNNHQSSSNNQTATPDPRIISEAIRSLAQVLCVQPKRGRNSVSGAFV